MPSCPALISTGWFLGLVAERASLFRHSRNFGRTAAAHEATLSAIFDKLFRLYGSEFRTPAADRAAAC